jgi:hypothetical protein
MQLQFPLFIFKSLKAEWSSHLCGTDNSHSFSKGFPAFLPLSNQFIWYYSSLWLGTGGWEWEWKELCS